MKMKTKRGKCVICRRNLRNHHKYCDRHWALIQKINKPFDYYAN